MRVLYELSGYNSELYRTFCLEERNLKAKIAVKGKLARILHFKTRLRITLQLKNIR